MKSTIRSITYRSYEQHVTFHITPHIGSLRLEKVSGATLNALYAKLAAEGKRDAKRAVPPQPFTTSALSGPRPSATRCAGTASFATPSMPPTRSQSRAVAGAR